MCAVTTMPSCRVMLLLMMMMMMMGVVMARPGGSQSHRVESTSGRRSSAGGCLGLGYCCAGRNVTCTSSGQRADNKDELSTCFCDEDCLTTGDCCLDYRAACRREFIHTLITASHTRT